MPVIEISDAQAIDLLRQLPPRNQASVMTDMARTSAALREERMAFAQQQIRQRCTERGLNWDTMSEDEREDFVQELVEED